MPIVPSPEAMRPLHGMRMKLERKDDRKNPCCSEFGIIHVSDAAEIWCAGCGQQRGELEPRIINWLLNVLAFFPDARESVPIVRDIDPNFVPLRPREQTKVYQSARKRKLNV
jgi:hypothetical protein